jgi:hypothetical protein
LRLRADFDATALPRRRNGANGVGRVHQCRLGNVIGIGKRGFLSRYGAHANALVDTETAAFDDALFQAPTFAAGVLKVEVSVVYAVGSDGLQRFGERGIRQTKRLHQQ